VSAVDANAVQRAKARAQYANMSRMKMTPGTAAVRKYSTKEHLKKESLSLAKFNNWRFIKVTNFTNQPLNQKSFRCFLDPCKKIHLHSFISLFQMHGIN
jgi:hypothetical protein